MPVHSVLARVAQAIANSQGASDWEEFVPAAQAALDAIRIPSTDMLNAAMPKCLDWGYLPEEWQSMIEHVLGLDELPRA